MKNTTSLPIRSERLCSSARVFIQSSSSSLPITPGNAETKQPLHWYYDNAGINSEKQTSSSKQARQPVPMTRSAVNDTRILQSQTSPLRPNPALLPSRCTQIPPLNAPHHPLVWSHSRTALSTATALPDLGQRLLPRHRGR